MRASGNLCLALCLAIAAALPAARPARAADLLRVGNDAPASLTYCALDVGIEKGIFAKHGLEIEPSTWFGTAKGQPALIGGTIDVLLGAGSEMAFIVKGAPEKAVAVIAGPPSTMALIGRTGGPVHSLKDHKGRKLGFTNTGGLTDWLARQIIRREGYAPGEVTMVAAGATPTETAMLSTGELDAAVMDIVSAYAVESRGVGHVIQGFGAYVPDFAQSVIYARDDLIAQHPDRLRAFFAAWFEANEAMLADLPAFIACTVRKTGASPEIAARVIAETKADQSPDGRFLPGAMEVLATSFVDTGVLPEKPDMTRLYTEAFLPKR